MNRTKIEWCDYTINPIKGLCPMHCKTSDGYEYCYAAGERGLYRRFKWNPEIRMEPDWPEELPKKPAKIFVGSTMELFGDWVEDWMWDSIWQYVNFYLQHTFIFLTKRPEDLIKWSPFPSNTHIGVSVTNQEQYDRAIEYLKDVKATVKFLSFEPLLSEIKLDQKVEGPNKLEQASINWVIIGQQTPASAKTAPKMSWIQEILVQAHNADNIPVFMKNNLQPLLVGEWAGWKLRQEFPTA